MPGSPDINGRPLLSAAALGSAIRNGEMTSEAVVRAALAAIAAGEPTLHAFITVEETAPRARPRARSIVRARRASARRADRDWDNLCVRGMKTTAGPASSAITRRRIRPRRRAPPRLKAPS